jgi:ketosteroid isomerase-like protein
MTTIYSSPQDAEDAFYDALEEGDLAALSGVWADSDDICCLLPMHPLVQGRMKVEELFGKLLPRGQGVMLSVRHLNWIEAGESAIHLLEESIENPPPGQPRPPPFYAINIYRKFDQGWRLMVHLNSPTPPPGAPGM